MAAGAAPGAVTGGTSMGKDKQAKRSKDEKKAKLGGKPYAKELTRLQGELVALQ